jgi:DNA-binding GntR family transcriptional regulator
MDGMAGEEIDPLGATPVYLQLASIVERRIRRGKIPPNRPVPSELQLQREFGVARGTARKAIAVLRDRGLVVTVPGRGTFVK